jgi:hypothetical protein
VAAAANQTAFVTGPVNPLMARMRGLTYKMQGKTVTESLADSVARKKAEQEIAEFRRFEQLVREFVEVNALICHARPVEETLTAQEKKRPNPSTRRSRAK